MGWLIAALILLAGASGGSKSDKQKPPPPPPPPGPTPPPAPGEYPTIEQVAHLVCVLFKSTHAAAPPVDIVEGAYQALGTSTAIMLYHRPQIHNAAMKLATALYNGEADCDDPTDDEYTPSAKLCSLTGEPYNAARWTTPDAVFAEMKQLGFATGPGATDKMRVDEVKRFQAIARSIGLGGYASAPASYVDGVIGACTLVALEEARARRLQGTWNTNVVAAAGPKLIPNMTATAAGPKLQLNPIIATAAKE